MNRRDLVKTLGLGAMTFGGGRLFAAGTRQPRFLLVFLRGGYDAASLLVPVSSSFYYESRHDIAIAKPSTDLNSALALNADWGLHPALRESIYPMYQRGEAAFIPFAGTPDTSRSQRAQMRRAARNFAISSKKSRWESKKKDRPGANSSTSIPRDWPSST